jgi:hypothetical protein
MLWMLLVMIFPWIEPPSLIQMEGEDRVQRAACYDKGAKLVSPGKNGLNRLAWTQGNDTMGENTGTDAAEKKIFLP